MTSLAPILEGFFTERLLSQQRVSPHTIASYRDTFKLLLSYIHQQTGKLPARLNLTDLHGAEAVAQEAVPGDGADVAAALHEPVAVLSDLAATQRG